MNQDLLEVPEAFFWQSTHRDWQKQEFTEIFSSHNCLHRNNSSHSAIPCTKQS